MPFLTFAKCFMMLHELSAMLCKVQCCASPLINSEETWPPCARKVFHKARLLVSLHTALQALNTNALTTTDSDTCGVTFGGRPLGTPLAALAVVPLLALAAASRRIADSVCLTN